MKKLAKKKDVTTEKFQGRALLPKGQFVETPEKNIAHTVFTDLSKINETIGDFLIAKSSEKLTIQPKQSFSKSTKIHHVDSWNIPGARFLDERAKALFRAITGHETAIVDLSWANVYQKGDYILPHAHSRATASLVYVVSMGDDSCSDPMAGKFAIADPRLPVCCLEDGKYMSNSYMPGFQEGSMIIFPGNVVHLVTPYMGEKPRITLAWNINAKALPPRSEKEQYSIPPHPGRPEKIARLPPE